MNNMDYTQDEIADLLTIVRSFGKLTKAHVMALKGHRFSVDQLIQLGDVVDSDGYTIAGTMAATGHIFSTYDILRLDNRVVETKYGNTLAHVVTRRGDEFSVDELIMFGNPLNSSGKTPADIMINCGHKFSIGDMARLGVEEYHPEKYLCPQKELILSPGELDELRARSNERWTEAERDALLLPFQQEEECRQAVEAGKEPPFEILLDRPDLLLKYGV